jgi:alkylhydroperoxidase/carboxymuconolactone decarboxylase family protein YurZ
MRTPGVADKMLASASDFTRPGVEYVLRNAFDGIWARDGLEKKYRSLVVISWVHTSLPTTRRFRVDSASAPAPTRTDVRS